MTIKVIAHKVYAKDETSVVFGEKFSRIEIHPWDRGASGSDVYVAIGDLKKDGRPRGSESDRRNGIFDRADFVEAILAVFPELVRAK